MPDALPIACSLTATELPARLETLAALGRDALLDHRLEGSRAELRFAAHDGVRDRVDAAVDAESRCCAFLDMRVTEAPGAVLLTITAPAGAEPVLAELVGAFVA